MPCWKWSGDQVSDLRYFLSCQKEGVVVDAKWLTDNTGSSYIIRRGGSLSCSARDGSISVVGWHPVLLLPEKFSKKFLPRRANHLHSVIIAEFGARAGKLAAGFFNRTATRISGRTILPTSALSPGVAKRVAVRAFLNIAGTRERAGTRAWQVHVRKRPRRGDPQADCVRRDRVRA